MTKNSTALVNENATIGHNEAPDYARQVTDRMASEYGETTRAVTEALNEARELPDRVDDDDAVSKFAAVIKRIRDVKARLIAYHKKEKEPYLRAGQGVDQFFFPLVEKLERRSKGDKPGAADILEARVHAYQQEKRDRERRAREEQERLAREAERKAREDRERAEREAREAQERADQLKRKSAKEAAEREAAEAKRKAEEARQREQIATETRRDASAEANVKAADLVRTRGEGGSVTTMRQVPYVEITDRMAIDMNILKPFFKDEHIKAALMMFGKTTNFKTPISGAILEMRDDTVVR